MSTDQNQVAIHVIGCMVEVLADEDGNIDQKCFEKIFTACIKAVIVGMKVGDQALVLFQQALAPVCTVLSTKLLELSFKQSASDIKKFV